MSELRNCPVCSGTGKILADPAKAEAARKSRNRRVAQDLTRPTAARHRDRWTTAEMALLDDPGMTDREIALRLGRTFDAVKTKRKKIRISERSAA